MNYKSLIVATSLTVSPHILAADYIVTFAPEDDAHALTNADKITAYKKTNDKNIERLFQSFPNLQNQFAIKKNLWAAGSVVMDLNSEQAQALRREAFIKNVAPDQKRHFLIAPTSVTSEADPSQAWSLEYLQIAKVREKYPEALGTGIRVGVLDTGIQSRHAEFAETGGVVFKDFVNNLPFPYDDHGHGTHVAGTISGVNVGVAPASSLTIGKILSASGSAFDSWILEGMQWMLDPDGDPATDDFPQVINNSWGGDLEDGPIDFDSYAAFHQTIQNWVDLGIIPVFAAGNSGSSPNGFPAAFPEVLSIGALDQSAEVAAFSSRGPNLWSLDQMIFSVAKPDFSLPGVDIVSAGPANDYALMSGTSMAAPHGVGILALYLQFAKKADVKAAKTALIKYSERKNDLSFGLGIPNTVELIGSKASSEPR